MRSLRSRFPIYSRLMGLYPRPYRLRYEKEILQTTADMLDGAAGNTARLAIWTRLAIDLPVNAGRQQLSHDAGVMKQDMPPYVKWNGLVAGLMLVPFFAALLANGLDKVINNHTLHNSWVWHSPAINIWVLWLPTLSFLLAAASYLVFAAHKSKASFLRNLVDVHHVWPIVLPMVGALFIMFVIAFH